MIIDSHVHYSHHLYDREYSYLRGEGDYFVTVRGGRKEMLSDIQSSSISLCIEPSTKFSLLERQMEIVAEHSPFLRLALGVHPKYCNEADWADRIKLRELAFSNKIIAIGETGLDYSIHPTETAKIYQMMWFLYHIRLANELKLPLILHTRGGDVDVLRILTRHKNLLHGGVAHCFHGDYQTASQYIDLGFSLGIGGQLLDNPILQDTVKRVPPESILVETDAPYIGPGADRIIATSTQKKKARNCSLILPAVIDKIAELRKVDRDVVEEKIYRNTLRVFRLN